LTQVYSKSDPTQSSAGATQYRSGGGGFTPYSVPDFGLDSDIITSNTNMKNAETKLGTWTLPKKK
jgi:hypothetical protein